MLWIIAILVFLLCVYIVRIIEGPSIWNRLLGMNLVTTKIILIIIVFASIHRSAFFLDFAIIYAICGFIGTIFLANFMSDRVAADKNENLRQTKKWLFEVKSPFKRFKGFKGKKGDKNAGDNK